MLYAALESFCDSEEVASSHAQQSPQRLHLGALGAPPATAGRRRLIRASLDQRQLANAIVITIHKRGLSFFSLVLLTSFPYRATPAPLDTWLGGGSCLGLPTTTAYLFRFCCLLSEVHNPRESRPF